MELITDRTQADVNRAKELNKKVYNAFVAMAAVTTGVDALIEPMEIVEATLTAEEFAEWQAGLKGAYNYTDLNRVESAVENISSFFGYGMTTKTDWKMSDEFTHAEMMRYLSNLQTIKEKCGSSIPIPQNMSQLTYQSANNIEKLMLDAYGYKNTYTAGKLSVGNILWFNVGGIPKEFIVVHQGNPDTDLYDTSCDGTWLLMKDIYTIRTWDIVSNDYDRSDIHSYLNDTFHDLLDSNIQSAIKSVKIPRYFSDAECVLGGSSGLDAKIFLLSGYEVGWTVSDGKYFPVDGACLSYFSGCSKTDPKRIAYYNGTATAWWLRSQSTQNSIYVWYVYSNGGCGNFSYNRSYGIRPAFILDSNTPIANITEKIS